MKNKIFTISLLLLALLAISAVSASENVTDDAYSANQDNPEADVLKQSDDTCPVMANDTSKVSSQLVSSKVKGYTTFPTTVSAKLTSNGKAISSKPVKILLNKVTYVRTTDNKGIVSLNVMLSKGTYNAVFIFEGDDAINSSTAKSKITIYDAIKTSIKQGDKYINYRQGSQCLFYAKLTDKNGKAIKNQMVTFKVSGKTYSAKTDRNGFAKIYLNLKKGTRKVTYSFKKTSPYLASSGSCKIKVKAKIAKGNGYWLWSSDMKRVNLKSLAKKGTKHIILHSQAVYQHGKSAVVSFIKKAHKNRIKVHLWMQIGYDGKKWYSFVNDNGKIKYSFFNKKLREAKRLAKIRGVDGIHFDYIRYGGTAHNHPNAVESINYFSKKDSLAIHKIRPNCIVSAALMPEPKMMHYYYGQDVPTMSKYMDVLIPMVYKGNYHQKSSWIASVTKTFVSQSNGAQIWTGLQAYHSDNNAKKLTQKELLKDARAAKTGGAAGIILFRIGISCNFNFKKV